MLRVACLSDCFSTATSSAPTRALGTSSVPSSHGYGSRFTTSTPITDGEDGHGGPDGVGDEAKEVVLTALVAGDLGRVVTTLLAADANDVAVLEVILTSPTADVDAKTAIADQLLREDLDQNIIERGAKGSGRVPCGSSSERCAITLLGRS
jgi:hypothetical protein